jgi:hypothetical protein
MQVRFEGILPLWLGIIIAILGSTAIWFWYRQETKTVRQPWAMLLPTLRATAFALMILMLTGPIFSRQWLSGSLSTVVVLIDESSSMGLKDNDPTKSRIDRVVDWLEDRESRTGWLQELSTAFRWKVFGFSSTDDQGDAIRRILDSASFASTTPVTISVQPVGRNTAIGDALVAALDGSEPPSAIVLATDGQSHSGSSVFTAADRLRDLQIPVFAVGYGLREEPNDLAVLSVEHPKSLLATEMFQGVATIKQQLPEQTPYRMTIRSQGRTIWSQSFVADGVSTRTIDYRVEGQSLFPTSADRVPSKNRSIPLDLEFLLEFDGSDAVESNDQLESSLWGVTQKNRVLVMDRRGRWESRYIKNAFQRDSAWELDAILGPEQFKERAFPKSREELYRYDILIMTVDSVPLWNDVQRRWVADHISESGAGILWIDSGRENSEDKGAETLDWFPVDYDKEYRSVEIRRFDLSPNAWNERAFSFEADSESNGRRWSTFPTPRVARRVSARPGAETWVSGKSEAGTVSPMIVTRQFGQGKVVYVAHDESWRWRYNVADLYHQRFWSQLAQWSMQLPFAMENDFAAFDTGDRTYEIGAQIPIRAELKNPDRTPMMNARAYATIQKEGIRIDSIPLSETPVGSGYYTGISPPMPPGKFTLTLEVPGLPVETVPWESEVIVQSKANIELQMLSQNSSLLRQLSDRTNGTYVDESEVAKLSDLLRPRATGRMERQDWALWQSYPWFIAIIALLSVEWFFRKRAGLV